MELKLRLFNQADAIFVSQWIIDPDYETFFRNNSILPTFEECGNYPSWSNNLVMMVMVQDQQNNWQTVGMVNGYHASMRNQSIHAGCLISVEAQKAGIGHRAFAEWVDLLLKRMGVRMVIAEIVDPTLIEPLRKCGFQDGGRIPEACKIKGEWVDEHRLWITKEHWRESYVRRK